MPTPNYGLNLPTDDDSMADVNFNLNDAWDIIETIPVADVVSTLPTMNFDYPLGSRIFNSVWSSTFVLVAIDASWGNFWQPIQSHFGPWVTPGSSIIANPGTYQFGSTPISYRLSNTGRFYLRGSVDTIASTGYQDFETGSASATLKNLPVAIAPAFRAVHMGSPYPQTSSTSKPGVAQISIFPDGHFTNVVWNPANNSTGLFYNGMEWTMGYSKGYGPDF